jgi:tetratricopeptide (TPR) repeat protein
MEALGGVCWWQGDIDGMAPAYREAVEIWRTQDNRSELANALYNYSFTFTVKDLIPAGFAIDGDADATFRVLLQEALDIYRELGDDRGEANVLWGIGNSRYFANDFNPASSDLALALEKFRKVGDRTMEAWTLHMLGGAYVRVGQLADARRDLTEALRIFSGASDATGLTLIFDDLSSLELADGHAERAARLWGAARALAKTTGAGLASMVDEEIESDARPHVRKALPPADLERLSAEGAAMTLDELVAYALGHDAD